MYEFFRNSQNIFLKDFNRLDDSGVLQTTDILIGRRCNDIQALVNTCRGKIGYFSGINVRLNL